MHDYRQSHGLHSEHQEQREAEESLQREHISPRNYRLTGFNRKFLTPGFIFPRRPSPPEERLSGEIFCRVISSHFLTFSTTTSSVYITVALAIERWYAVARPLQYRAKFHTKRLICEVFIIWGLSLAANVFLLFEV